MTTPGVTTAAARLTGNGKVEVTTVVEVTIAVENVVVMLTVSKWVEVVVVVSVFKAVVVSGTSRVVSCVCSSVRSKD